MSPRKRILVVDDSVVVRRAVSNWLSSDSALEVLATASTGKLALERIGHTCPDLVLLDFDMPEMDGLETLRRIRAMHRELPVLMFSASTERGALLTLDALAAGASDYVTKPASVGAHSVTSDEVREELLAKVHALVDRDHERGSRLSSEAMTRAPASGSVERSGIELIVLGASTGGPNAIRELLAALPEDLRVPVLVVQHMPPVFTRIFAERLDAELALRVCEARSGELLLPGQVWVAPGDYHLTVQRDGACFRTSVSNGPPENSCRPAVDVLFRSAAACVGRGVLGIVLTGMGQDGLRGAEAIRSAGGQVVVQDEATSVVWSMPGSVAKAGFAQAVLPISELGAEVLRRVAHGSLVGSSG